MAKTKWIELWRTLNRSKVSNWIFTLTFIINTVLGIIPYPDHGYPDVPNALGLLAFIVERIGGRFVAFCLLALCLFLHAAHAGWI